MELDILRGVALAGILTANMRGFSAPMDVYFDIGRLFPDPADRVAQFLVDVFISGKFVTLFSFMFGLGFAAQMARAEARGAHFLEFYPRRLAALALFGAIHGIAVWAGDILLTYAIGGTLLLFLRHRPQRFLARFVFLVPLSTTLIMTVFTLLRVLGLRKPPEPEVVDMAEVARAVRVYSHGSVFEFFQQNWFEWTHELNNVGYANVAVVLFAMGLWVYREGIPEHLAEHRSTLKRVLVWTLPLGLALNFAGAVVSLQYPVEPRPVWAAWSDRALGIWAPMVLSAGYACGIALLLLNAGWRRRLMPFAAVGRMALTNYLSQSILCVAFFRFTHLHGVWGPAWDIVPTVVLFSVQIAWSNWWLRRFRFGPMEWLWRGLTYGRWPRMRVGFADGQ